MMRGEWPGVFYSSTMPWKGNSENFDIFVLAWWRFSVVRLFGGCRSTVRFPTQYACNRAGYVDREGEGSTGPSRGEHRLTVYRAHASWDQEGLSKSGVNGSEKWRFLRIHEFVSLRSNFPTFLRSRPIQECTRCVCLCVLEKVVLLDGFEHASEKSRFSWIFDFSLNWSGSS